MVYIVDEVDSEKISKMTKEMMDFGVVVVDEILKAYDERINMIRQLEA